MPNRIQRAIADVRQQINDYKANASTKAKATHATDKYQAQNFYDALTVLHQKHGDGKRLHINHGKAGAYLSKNVPNWVKKLVYHDKRQSRSEVVQSVADKGLNSNNPLAQQAAKDLLALTDKGIVNSPELRTAAWTIQNPGKPNPYDDLELSAPQSDAVLDKAYRQDVEQGAFDKADMLFAPAPTSSAAQEPDTDDAPLDPYEADKKQLLDKRNAPPESLPNMPDYARVASAVNSLENQAVAYRLAKNDQLTAQEAADYLIKQLAPYDNPDHLHALGKLLDESPLLAMVHEPVANALVDHYLVSRKSVAAKANAELDQLSTDLDTL